MGKTVLALATAAAALMATDGFAASLSPTISMHHMSAFRIEPPRPGGLYGLPRGGDGARSWNADLTTDKPTVTNKRRPR